mmetsp:Transcript_979/g.1219  ORF Transcript_979/g.1219 Transcript_979/m.1219 type:complete len:714 (-) Transcript_979:42-2183(-)
MSSLSPDAMNNSLKAAQLRAINRMLAFNEETFDLDSSRKIINNNSNSKKSDYEYALPPAGSSHNQWKILIYDVACRSIISPLLSVAQLRRRGVTLHLLLNSDREPIPDVPAIYFCQPTTENLARIAQDSASRLYGRFHLNFCNKINRTKMEEFGRLIVQANALDTIASIHDQYLDYVCLERNLFSLHRTDSYVKYNGSGATEQSIEVAMDEIAHGLFSVVASLGHVPIIRCARSGAPEMVARKLHRMISEHPTLMRGSSKAYRPLLVLMDRNADLVTPIQHASTYQALIDDLLTHKANRVEFTMTPINSDIDASKSRAPKASQKRYDLDPDEDPFYASHKFNPFPKAIEQNGVELQEVTQRETEIRSSAGGGVSLTGGGMGDGTGAADLATAVDSLPALLDRKKQLEIHTSILQAVMTKVAARDIPQFYELESDLASGAYKNNTEGAKTKVIEMLTDPSKGTIEDKVRLVLVYALNAPGSTNTEIQEVAESMKSTLETRGSALNSEGNQHGLLSIEDRSMLAQGMRAIQYVIHLRSMNIGMISITAQHQDVVASATSEASPFGDSSNLTSFMKNATSQATGLLAKASEKVGSMLSGKSYKHPLTRVVENLCEFKVNTEDDTYLYLDPKISVAEEINVATMLRNTTAINRVPVRDVICFTIGGGCYTEYQNLQLLVSSSDSAVSSSIAKQRTITYGSTELLPPEFFLQQLGKLG